MAASSRPTALRITLALTASTTLAYAASAAELQRVGPSIAGKSFTPIPPVGAVWPEQEEKNAYDPDCLRPKDHDEADLCIQREMRNAAASSVWWATVQTVVGAIGLLGVVGSLALSAWAAILSRRSADASRESVQVARRAFENEQRAWLTVAATADRQCGFGSGDTLHVGASFVVKNIGKSPAKNVNRHILAIEIPEMGLQYADTSMGHMIDLYYKIYKEWIDGSLSSSSDINALMPGDTKGNFGIHAMYEMPNRSNTYWLFYGATYNDGVSAERRLTASLIILHRADRPDYPGRHLFEGSEHGDFARAAVAF